MRFLIDAHLPRRLAYRLKEMGHDVVHTLDLPDQNRTSDTFIEELSLRDHRVVITKDSDFVNTYLLHGRPYKLLLVSTGNITNQTPHFSSRPMGSGQPSCLMAASLMM